jgi:hypothetical protein
MVASSTESKQSKLPIIGIIGLIVMLIAFWLIREFWQKGGRPFSGVPGADFIAIVILVITLAAVYYVHKRTK